MIQKRYEKGDFKQISQGPITIIIVLVIVAGRTFELDWLNFFKFYFVSILDICSNRAGRKMNSL